MQGEGPQLLQPCRLVRKVWKFFIRFESQPQMLSVCVREMNNEYLHPVFTAELPYVILREYGDLQIIARFVSRRDLGKSHSSLSLLMMLFYTFNRIRR